MAKMYGAVVENGICVNVAVFADDADLVDFGAVEIPDGYGIGDLFDGSSWTKAPEPEPAPEPAPEPVDKFAEIEEAYIDMDFRLTCLELGL